MFGRLHVDYLLLISNTPAADDVRQAINFHSRARNDFCILKDLEGRLFVGEVLCMSSFVHDSAEHRHHVLCINQFHTHGRDRGTGMVLLLRQPQCRFVFADQVVRRALVQPCWSKESSYDSVGRFLLNDLVDLDMYY